MLISTIIPTVGRNSLPRAVKSVLGQDGFSAENHELIVVNDTGNPLPTADWMHDPRVQLLTTQRLNRAVARNVGAAVAQGRYLHFLDDDDWMELDAFKKLCKVIDNHPDTWAYGGYDLLDRDGGLLEACRPNETGNVAIRFVAGEWLPLQASLIPTSAFFQIGGFTDLRFLRGGNEDVHLPRQLSLFVPFVGIAEKVCTIPFGLEGSTTNFTNLHEQSRVSREFVLDEQEAFAALRASAENRSQHSAYWFGRLFYTYLASTQWQFKERRPLRAFGRSLNALRSLLLSITKWTNREFWRGALRPHQTQGWLEQHI